MSGCHLHSLDKCVKGSTADRGFTFPTRERIGRFLLTASAHGRGDDRLSDLLQPGLVDETAKEICATSGIYN